MKITDEMIDVARDVFDIYGNTLITRDAIYDAIYFALRVRKARKAARRKETKNLYPNSPTAPTSTPAWDGKFEAGKSYRSRGGLRAQINDATETALYGQIGAGRVVWQANGAWSSIRPSQMDLIAPLTEQDGK